MPFIAECPFCHHKLRAPDSAEGRSLPCPTCGEPFTLAAMENPPHLVTFIPAPVTPGSAPALLPGSQTAAILPPLPATVPEKEGRAGGRRRRVNLAALAAFFFASVGVLSAAAAGFFVFEIAASAALAFAGVGLVLGLAGLLVARKTRQGGLKLALAGTGLSLALLLVLVFHPALLGVYRVPLLSLLAPPPQEALKAGGRTVVISVGKEVPDPESGEDPEPEATDVRRKEVQQGDLRVRVVSVTSRVVEFKKPAPSNPPLQRFLVVGLRLYNVGINRRIPYESWGESGTGKEARLTDEAGKSYRLRTFGSAEVVGHVRGKNLTPGTVLDDVLVFETPPSSVRALHLELPAEAAGGTGTFKLRIPREAIRSR
jgi:hypothetical protein